MADEVLVAGAPPFEALQATLIAAEALTAADRLPAADQRLSTAADNLDPKNAPAAWGEYLRLRGALDAKHGSAADAYHAFAQSATLLDLLGERYQAGLSHLAVGRLVAQTGARSIAEHHLAKALAIFRELGADRDRADTEAAEQLLAAPGSGDVVISAEHADDAIVRRIVDAAALPELLGREIAAALFEAAMADASVVFVQLEADEVRIVGARGCDADVARSLARAGSQNGIRTVVVRCWSSRSDGISDGPRFALVASPRPIGHPVMRRLRMIAAVARQGFALCAARDRFVEPAGVVIDRSLEPLLPGFLSASTAMSRVVEQIQRLQGNDLTVLITGESGTGKELVARAIHVGSHRSAAMFLPYNCTTTGRDLADSQLFGHRRGSVHRRGLRPAGPRAIGRRRHALPRRDRRPAARRPAEAAALSRAAEIMPIGETRPQRVDVRVLAATNADLEQRVAEGKFREDLYYRLNVIRIHVPPLRERREEIPAPEHVLPPGSAGTARQAGHRTSARRRCDVFSQYWWPGNVRQLKNEIQRAVALSAPGGTIEPSPSVAGHRRDEASQPAPRHRRPPIAPAATNLASAVEQVERDLIQAALDRTRGNISESARTLGLTRRGLYLKLRRLGLAARADVDIQYLDTE